MPHRIAASWGLDSGLARVISELFKATASTGDTRDRALHKAMGYMQEELG